ncbi:hydrogenase expression/formation protein HypE [Caldicellulosiruptor kronotskyensis 2002]|uniref:Hydrogenase expression/formation protein HypE n=1 Tax=Caldicellulosiruptor kronotskyensis (strain DSM 18902 / VKM B-2412 / 2002) TaxID=632348 RepID=E4SFC8_CALK2|nr:hydrogenase expression/formation protein HypE [Caldicellulosiruptor kronotskyensis]ADQ46453.1 hydrogenase expression/formation protein HypE [Caldicellulosiruptor kronotskyensis 2002]
MMRTIRKEHGNGGKQTYELIDNLFKPIFGSEILKSGDDSTVFSLNGMKVGISTDSFVVKPYFFKGGDIGKLSVCGTVNDLAVAGLEPKYITVSFIIEEGFSIDDLEKITRSIKRYADLAKVEVVAGDTKVVEKGAADGIFINTTGLGVARDTQKMPSISRIKGNQVVIVSGDIGRHGACIYSHNEDLGFEDRIESDCGLLLDVISELMQEVDVAYMKDLTRGGLATALNEIVQKSGFDIKVEEEKIPVADEVKALCDILGLDSYYLACEGRFVAIVNGDEKEKAIEILKKYNRFACEIGKVEESREKRVYLSTTFGGTRILDMLYYEMLPRIC